VEATRDPTAHAEMLCLRRGAAAVGGWRLLGATLYVTLEPCPMCAGALLQARVDGLVYGARNRLLGADGSWIAMLPRDGGGQGGAADSTDSASSGGSASDTDAGSQQQGQWGGCLAGRTGGAVSTFEIGSAACGCSDAGPGAACSSHGKGSFEGSAAPAAAADAASALAAVAGASGLGAQSLAAPRHPFHASLRVVRGVLEDECSAVMKAFFRARRQQEGMSSGSSSSSSSSDEGTQ
jgi:tRNA(Arg) A34 adenosine deaminase TadA